MLQSNVVPYWQNDNSMGQMRLTGNLGEKLKRLVAGMNHAIHCLQEGFPNNRFLKAAAMVF